MKLLQGTDHECVKDFALSELGIYLVQRSSPHSRAQLTSLDERRARYRFFNALHRAVLHVPQETFVGKWF